MIRLFPAVITVLCATPAFAADWPQWRGPNRDGVSKETGLLAEWPKDGPPVRWERLDLGTGYSSPIVVNGVVYIQTTKGNDEFTVALQETTGKEIWSTKIGLVGKNTGPNYPGTRATVTFDNGKLYCLASDGELNCLEAKDGKILWHKNFPKEFGGKVGFWAYTESVLVDGDAVVCTPGGESATLAKLNKMTGEVIWKSAVPGGDLADYASIMPVMVNGKKQYVQYMRKAFVGVDAETGKFLWKHTKTQDAGASILTPVVSGSRVFISGSRTGGAGLELAVSNSESGWEEKYFDKKLSPSIGGAILHDGYLYGTNISNQLFCADFKTGEIKWSDSSVGAASLCAADGKLYVRGQNKPNEIALVALDPKEYKEISRFKQPHISTKPGWPHPVVANGGFYIRDMDALICFEVKK
jgi:outer membrane protein assembly factor BamB